MSTQVLGVSPLVWQRVYGNAEHRYGPVAHPLHPRRHRDPPQDAQNPISRPDTPDDPERGVSFEHHDDGLNVDTSMPRPASGSSTAPIYVDGQRVATMDSIADTVTQLDQHPGGIAWIGLYRPTDTEIRALAEQFGLHPLGGRGRHPRPPAPQARTLRRHAVRRAAPRPLPRRSRRGRVRRGARVRRAPTSCSPSATARRPSSAACGAGSSANPSCWRGSRGGALRRDGRGRRRLLAGGRRARATTSTRSRSRSSSATPRSRAASTSCRARSPTSSAPRDPSLDVFADLAGRVRRSTRSTTSCSATSATSTTTSPDHRAHRGVPHGAPRHAHRQRDARGATSERRDAAPHRDEQRAERRGQEDLGLGRDPVRPHPRSAPSTA